MQPLHSYPNDDTLNVWAPQHRPGSRRPRVGLEKHRRRRRPACFRQRLAGRHAESLERLANRCHSSDARRHAGRRLCSVTASYRRAKLFDGYTLGAAFAGRREKTEGSLEPGKLADIIILSQNIFEIDPHKISETKVPTTIVGGRVVYQARCSE